MKYTTATARQRKKVKGKPWQACVKYKDAHGDWKTTYKTLPKDVKGKKEAERLAKEWMGELNAALCSSPEIPYTKHDEYTVDDAVVRYLDYQFSVGELEQSTYDAQLRAYKNRVSPYIGSIGFHSLDRIMVMDWLTKMNAEGLSQNTIYYYFKIPCKTYNYYLTIGEVSFNPFEQVKKPVRPTANTTHLTQEQTEELFKAIDEEYPKYSQMYTAMMLVFYAGLRRQEVCGLRWRNVNFTTGTITIDTAIAVARGKTYAKQPKTGSSQRVFPMVSQLRNYLQELKSIDNPEKNWFVVGKKTDYLTPHMFTKNFGDFVKKYNLIDAYDKKIIPHGLRHNFAAVGIRAKMDIASLSQIMGHSSIKETLDIYGDASETAKKVAVEQLETTFQAEQERRIKESGKLKE